MKTELLVVSLGLVIFCYIISAFCQLKQGLEYIIFGDLVPHSRGVGAVVTISASQSWSRVEYLGDLLSR